MTTEQLIRGFIGAALVASLSACSDSGSTATNVAGASDDAMTDGDVSAELPVIPTTQDVLSQVANGRDAFDGLEAIPGTAFAQIPTTGSAALTGSVVVSVSDSREVDGATVYDKAVDMSGEVAMTYDFTDQTFEGELTDFIAVQYDGNTFDTALVDGLLDVSGGQANAISRPTLLEGTAEGTLAVFDETYAIDMDLDGLMRGTRLSDPERVRAITLEGQTETVPNQENILIEVLIGAEN